MSLPDEWIPAEMTWAAWVRREARWDSLGFIYEAATADEAITRAQCKDGITNVPNRATYMVVRLDERVFIGQADAYIQQDISLLLKEGES